MSINYLVNTNKKLQFKTLSKLFIDFTYSRHTSITGNPSPTHRSPDGTPLSKLPFPCGKPYIPIPNHFSIHLCSHLATLRTPIIIDRQPPHVYSYTFACSLIPDNEPRRSEIIPFFSADIERTARLHARVLATRAHYCTTITALFPLSRAAASATKAFRFCFFFLSLPVFCHFVYVYAACVVRLVYEWMCRARYDESSGVRE